MGNIFSVSLSCDNLIFRCWDCVAGDALYTCQLKGNLGSLQLERNKLEERRNDVMRRVQVAEQAGRDHMKRLDKVEGWRSRADTLINDVDQLLVDGPEVTGNLYLGGCCSNNCKSTYKFGKTVAQRLRDVRDLINQGDFPEVATPVPAPPTIERPTGDSAAVGLESVFDKVKSSIGDKDVGVIGIYGKGGVGKSRLMIEINNKIGTFGNEFDVVIWVTVSKGFYLGKVQDDIAERLGLSINETWLKKTPQDKATEILRVLKEKKFALLLDDIWERVDLSKVGIPPPTEKDGSKLIFTTRSLEVCGKMRADKKIQVTCLPGKEAWELFEHHVGKDHVLHSNPEMRKVAQDVAKECGGLPLALITTGGAMACKTKLEEWKYSLEVLRRSATLVLRDMGEEVYTPLKFSYDNLPNDTLRFCLLYCSLFPEDFHINKDVLIDCWMGEGILDGNDNYINVSQSRNQGHDIIGTLVHACLLEEVGEWGIKMHDVIRDMCLWIACKCEAEKWKFFVEAGYGLTQVPDAEKWGNIQRMSLMQNKIQSLAGSPDCPHLQALFLDYNGDHLKEIQSDFFQFMRGLKVLSLRGNRCLPELPAGISKLVCLQYLDLSYTRIEHLPIELKALAKLKCLDLRRSGRKNWTIWIPRGLIAGFSKLQILRMMGTGVLFKEEDGSNDFLVEELQCLKHLKVLSVTVTSCLAIDGFSSAHKLHSSLEDMQVHLRCYPYWDETKQWNILPLAKFERLNTLELYRCSRLEQVEKISGNPSQSQPCFQSLSRVTVEACGKLRDVTCLILAPNLKSVRLHYCYKLEQVINKEKAEHLFVDTLTPFAKLESLALGSLNELKSIYWDALPFPCLNEISVSICPKLRRLPLNSNSSAAKLGNHKITIRGERSWWNELQWEDESTRNAFLPSFVAH